MESLGLIVDASVGVLVVVSAYLAMVRGFIRELFALASWVIAFFAALFLAPMLKPALTGLPVVGDLLENCQILAFSSFVVVFGLALIATGLVFYIFSGPTRNTTASVIDQGLGFMYGAIRGLVLVAVVYIAYVTIEREANGLGPDGGLPQGRYEAVRDAYSIQFVRPVAEFFWDRTPSEMPGWLASRAEELMGECENQ